MKTKYMIGVAVAGLVSLGGCGVASDPIQCTTAPQSQWMDQDQFAENLLVDGYTVDVFKVSEGNCYELYGIDPEGRKVEIYFNPVNGNIIKQ
jgi:hypothetical protein